MTANNFSLSLEGMAPTVRRFFEFHQRHPEIYRHFIKYAKDLLGAKPNRAISSQMIVEVIRYNILLKEDDVELYKINNDFAAGYARLFMRDFPRYNGLITTRKSVYDDYFDNNKSIKQKPMDKKILIIDIETTGFLKEIGRASCRERV